MVIDSPIPVGRTPDALAVTPDGSRVYVANFGGSTVSVIDTATNTVIATITVGSGPGGVAVTPDGSRLYITNSGNETVSVIDTTTNTVIGSPIRVGPIPAGVAVTPGLRRVGDKDRRDEQEDKAMASKVFVANNFVNTVSVIDTATNTVIATITVGSGPGGVAVTPDLRRDGDGDRRDEREDKARASKVYVANHNDNTVSVIDAATNTVIGSPITVGNDPYGVAVTPNGRRVYVTNRSSNTVSVIDTATNTVIGSPIPVGNFPIGVAVTPDGRKVFVANFRDNTVSVIATATNTVIGSPIPVASGPVAFGVFIRPGPRFAGTPGFSNCHGQSVAALTRQFGGLKAAAAALAFPSVEALQDAIKAFCHS
jgi:YVTN family beta-propeller protein